MSISKPESLSSIMHQISACIEEEDVWTLIIPDYHCAEITAHTAYGDRIAWAVPVRISQDKPPEVIKPCHETCSKIGRIHILLGSLFGCIPNFNQVLLSTGIRKSSGKNSSPYKSSLRTGGPQESTKTETPASEYSSIIRSPSRTRKLGEQKYPSPIRPARLEFKDSSENTDPNSTLSSKQTCNLAS